MSKVSPVTLEKELGVHLTKVKGMIDGNQVHHRHNNAVVGMIDGVVDHLKHKISQGRGVQVTAGLAALGKVDKDRMIGGTRVGIPQVLAQVVTGIGTETGTEIVIKEGTGIREEREIGIETTIEKEIERGTEIGEEGEKVETERGIKIKIPLVLVSGAENQNGIIQKKRLALLVQHLWMQGLQTSNHRSKQNH